MFKVEMRSCHYFVFVFILACLFGGCKPRGYLGVGEFLNDFSKVEELAPSDSISLKPFGITLPEEFDKYGDWFVVKTSQEESYIRMVNPKEGRTIRLFHKGRGPGELTYSRSWQILGDTLRIYDSNLKNYYFIDLSRTVQEGTPAIISREEFPAPESHTGPYHPAQLFHIDRGYISFGDIGAPCWYCLLNDNGELIDQIPLPDFKNLESVPDGQLHQIGSTSYSTIKPDGNAMAAAMLDADAISFSSINEAGLNEYKRFVFSDTEKTLVSGRLQYEKTASYHFLDAGCNERYVFFLYSGMQILGEDPPFDCHDLLVYDWDGNPVKRVILKRPVSQIHIEGDTLFGCSMSPDAAIFTYDLSNI